MSLTSDDVKKTLNTTLKGFVGCDEEVIDNTAFGSAIIAGSFLRNFVHNQVAMGDIDIFLTDPKVGLFDDYGDQPTKLACDIKKVINDHLLPTPDTSIDVKNLVKSLEQYNIIGTNNALTFSAEDFDNFFGNWIKFPDDILKKVEKIQVVFCNPTNVNDMDKHRITRKFDFLHAMPYYDLAEGVWYSNERLNEIIAKDRLIFNPTIKLVTEGNTKRYWKFIARGMVPDNETRKRLNPWTK